VAVAREGRGIVKDSNVELRVRVAKDLHRKLKERARQERRSLSAQIGYLLEREVGETKP
jgi:predicted HicB family RNase H-like nuclease